LKVFPASGCLHPAVQVRLENINFTAKYCIIMIETMFNTVRPEELPDNFFRLINDDWMLITAGQFSNYNTMTASWGTTGILWNKPIAICFIRPHRFTFQFAERHDYYTLSFFDEHYRNILDYCGAHSGRDINKAEQTGLKPLETGRGNITFSQARLVLECRKLYADFLKPENFLVQDFAARFYPKSDFHKFYIGEIEQCYLKK
jgi:flavin reductase (DIM6/NTAB) family NADH-FMN oxidoreductase RutF